MHSASTALPGAYVITLDVYGDARGFFAESFQEERYRAALHMPATCHFVQDNVSCSAKGVLRGLHFQRAPHMQGKLVSVLSGAVWDVAVDLRRASPTYGQYTAVTLRAPMRSSDGIWHWQQFWIPPGFAHGFLTLEDQTLFVYKCTDVYAPDCDGGIAWNDPDIAIPWPCAAYNIATPLVSAKDAAQPFLRTCEPLIV